MTGRTHDLAAITTLGVLVLLQPIGTVTLSTAIAAVLANLVGGIAPDIDQPTAPFWRNLPVGKYFGKVFGVLNGGHRFLTHSLVGLVLFGFVARAFLLFIEPLFPTVNMYLVWLAFMVGMVSHLVMDSFTREGVPWLLPIPIKFGFPPVKRLRMVTGKKFEAIVVFPGLLLFNAWWLGTHHQQILDIMHRHLV